MDCRECEQILPEYVLDDLEYSVTAACRAHLDGCSECSAKADVYKALIRDIADQPMLAVSAAESRRMAHALDQVNGTKRAERLATVGAVWEFLGFSLASILAFALMATALTLHAFGLADMFRLFETSTWLSLIIAGMLIVVVTSFIPIVVTARRRPLNGLAYPE